MARPTRRRMGGIATPWYRMGGISPSNILGAWAPKKAASYAASKISLVSPSASNLLVDGAAAPTWANGTGWIFNGTTQYLTIASAIATAVPVSIVCRFSADAVNAAYYAVSICDTASGAVAVIGMRLSGDIANDPVYALVNSAYGVSTSGFVQDVFCTGAAVFSANDARAAYVDGGNKGTETTLTIAADIDTTYIGAVYYSDTLQTFLAGKISACAIYNIALSDAQVLAVHNAMVIQGL